MPALDAPDWQHVIVTVSGMTVDAPDWQDTVVGPGGTPVGGGGYASLTGVGQSSTPGALQQLGDLSGASTATDHFWQLDSTATYARLIGVDSGNLLISSGGGYVNISNFADAPGFTSPGDLALLGSHIIIDTGFSGNIEFILGNAQVSGGTLSGVIAGLVALGLFSS